jgi:hypothetical protein
VRVLAFFLLVFGWVPLTAFAQSANLDEEMDVGSGFVEVEGGWLVVLSERENLEDAFTFDLNLGFSLLKEFKGEDADWLTFGPKVGFIMGRELVTNNANFFWDALLNIRYSFGQRGDIVRLYVEAGPGATAYGGTAFEMAAAAGTIFTLGAGTLGLNASYKEIVGSKYFHRGMTFMGSLGYPF